MINNLFLSITMLSALMVGSVTKPSDNIKPSNRVIGSGSQTLRLLNVEDYIYEQETSEDPESFVVLFENYAKELGYKNCKVEYMTTDTPESMFNQVKLSPEGFDLICPSDYMIQKLIVNDMIEPMHIDEDHMPNYISNASQIKNRLDKISAVNSKTNETCYLKDYAVGYMWGTLGILFDPSYGGRDPEQTIHDMEDWSVLWNPDYKGISSIKDSVRDTYAIGLLEALRDDFEENGAVTEGFETLMNKHNDGTYSDEEYNEKFSELFNYCDNATLEKVRKSLTKLKGNVFGMEVDSGKQDIVTGKIGINFAWSGDAVYSMEQAEEEKELELCYSIPQTGSNLWMDAWCMPKATRSDAQRELAELFLDFLSTPEYTALNMEYTGYTPFTAGNEILELTRSWYDYRYDEETEEFDDVQYTEEEMEELELQKVDLSYFFAGTLTGDLADDENACIFYSDCYLPYSYEDEDGEIHDNKCVGREFFCQFPDEETLSRCAVMRDFGSQNDAVLKMWEKFKSDNLPVWAIVLFAVEISVAALAAVYFIANKQLKKSFRRKRLENNNKN